MNPTPLPHNDGLDWLREVHTKMLQQANGDVKKLGDRYRNVQGRHPKKTFNPHGIVIRVVK